MADFDVIVIGAGVIGLACAARLADLGRSVLVLERHAAIARETSSRNSGVVHAGLYYPKGSLKAELCMAGRELLYQRCAARGIPHARPGKLVVAADETERDALANIARQAEDNGVPLGWLDAAEIKRLEPRLRAVAALWSPHTGIVDAHALSYDLHAQAKSLGATVRTETSVVGLEFTRGDWYVTCVGRDQEQGRVTASWVVNAAGLGADVLASLAGIDVEALGWRQRWCKGDYFVLSPRLRGVVSRLVYPVPGAAGLGIHLTLDLGGNLLAGPDAQYVERMSYDVDPAKAVVFARAVARYLPDLSARDLAPGTSGIRPKLQGPGEPFRDFVIEEAAPHGAPRLINLLGMESPGLTASLAIAKRVAALSGAH